MYNYCNFKFKIKILKNLKLVYIQILIVLLHLLSSCILPYEGQKNFNNKNQKSKKTKKSKTKNSGNKTKNNAHSNTKENKLKFKYYKRIIDKKHPYPTEITKLIIQEDEEFKTIEIYSWFNIDKEEQEPYIILIENLIKNYDIETANQLLEISLNDCKYYEDEQEGVKGNGRYDLIEFALKNGAEINSISLIKSLPEKNYTFIRNIRDSIPIMSLLLALFILGV